MATADPTAVISLFISTADTLDHHQTPGIDHLLFFSRDPLPQLDLGQHALLFSVKIFGGLVFLSAGRDDRNAVTYLPDHPPCLQRCGEVAHIAGYSCDGRIRCDMNQGMLIDIFEEILHISLNIKPFKGERNLSGNSSQFRFLFQQEDLESLVGETQGAGHPCHASAHHQRPLINRQLKFLQWLKPGGPGHSHPDGILCLLGGHLFFPGMDPGAVLPDIGHLKIIWIDSPFTKCISKQGFMGSGSAGRNDYTIQSFLLNRFRNLFGRVSGAGKESFLRVDDMFQSRSIFSD